jgi:hypothetical protein
MSVVDDFLVKAIWGDTLVEYSFLSATGASGGLVTMWDCNYVQVWSTTWLPHILIIRGRVLQTNQNFVIVNVYAPCDTALKQVLWDQLLNIAVSIGETDLCLCGDFNSIRSTDERRGRGSAFRQHDSYIFNNLIDEGNFVDLPICSRLFTWYRGDGYSMSYLDRFLFLLPGMNRGQIAFGWQIKGDSMIMSLWFCM